MPIPYLEHLATMATVLLRVARLLSKPRSVNGLEFAKPDGKRSLVLDADCCGAEDWSHQAGAHLIGKAGESPRMLHPS